MAASLIQRGLMRSRRLHLRDFNLRSAAANLQRPPNKRLEKDFDLLAGLALSASALARSSECYKPDLN
jgi:hypothetical protein